MKLVDGCLQKTSQAAETTGHESSTAAYQPPRAVHLGKSTDLIRGNWTSGVWDQGQGGPQWYTSGE